MEPNSKQKVNICANMYNFSRKGQLYIECIERQHTVQYGQ